MENKKLNLNFEECTYLTSAVYVFRLSLYFFRNEKENKNKNEKKILFLSSF